MHVLTAVFKIIIQHGYYRNRDDSMYLRSGSAEGQRPSGVRLALVVDLLLRFLGGSPYC